MYRFDSSNAAERVPCLAAFCPVMRRACGVWLAKAMRQRLSRCKASRTACMRAASRAGSDRQGMGIGSFGWDAPDNDNDKGWAIAPTRTAQLAEAAAGLGCPEPPSAQRDMQAPPAVL